MVKIISLFALVVLLFQACNSISSKRNNFPPTELKALQDLYDSTKGEYWSWTYNGKKWNFTEIHPNPCYEKWEGIECTSSCLGIACNVASLALQNYNLTGKLPHSLGSFRELRLLNLRSNQLNYSIPEEVGNLTKLSMLDLSHNYLSNTLPASIGQLANLEILTLTKNFLAGRIPATIGNLSNLRILRMNENFFQTHIPKEIGKLNKLKTLDLASNMLSGTIPESITYLYTLEVLELSLNGLNESIPSGIGQLTNLTHLGLGVNVFSSMVPRSIYHLSNLQFLNVGDNYLYDIIPADIGNMTALQVLIMSRNLFTGTIPEAFCALTQLKIFSLTDCYVYGSIPWNITKLTNLRELEIFDNALSGPIPSNLFEHLTALQQFSIYKNYFTGQLPKNTQYAPNLFAYNIGFNVFTGYLPVSLGFCTQLTYVSLSVNYFIGSIPVEYGNLSALVVFYLFNNHITGSMPISFTSLSRLYDLELEYNFLSGTLPNDIGNMQHLVYFGLNDNSFSGTLPVSLSRMNTLLVCTLQNNFFTGSLPPTIETNWSTLEIFLLQNNYFTGKIDAIVNMPRLANLNFSTNKFSGSINKLSFDFADLTSFDLSNNRFTGTLTHVFDQMPSLTNLNLAHNQFSGDLTSIFSPAFLMVVDISDNSFSGTLPAEAFNSTQLFIFAAVKNCLTGTLPTDVICNSKSLSTLALDGLHTADNCQDRFFPDFPFITSYQLLGTSKGSLPECLFNMTSLQTLHLSGNGFTGSIPSNVIINGSLSDVSLSYNQLTGSMPDWMQQKVWKNLDVSFNKLNGELKNTFAVSDNSTSLTMIVNRLSGNIPTSLLTVKQVDMLQGNIFRCDTSGMLGDTSRSLPNADVESSTYDCGSDSVNTAMYIWLIVGGSFFIGIAATAVVIFKSADADETTKSKVSVTESSNVLLNVWKTNVDEWLRIYNVGEKNKSEDKLSTRKGQSDQDDGKDCEDKELDSMYLLGKSLTMIRTMAWRIAAFALLILLPIFSTLAGSFSTHSYVYIWTVALAYLSGWTPALVVFFIMVIFYVCLASRLIGMILHSRDLTAHYQYQHTHYLETSSLSFARLYSYVACHHFTQADIKKGYVYFGIIFFNVTVVLAVNIAYVYTTTLSLNQSAIFFVEITISLFKISWGAFMLSYFFSRMLKSVEEDKNIRVMDHQISDHTIENLKFLSRLTIFNNIIAPFLADAFVDPDCFRYVINSQSAVTTSYYSEVCYIFEFFVTQGPTISVACYRILPTVMSTTYNPPFVYSYQCTSALLNGFINVFIYRYLITGILLPCVRILFSYLHEKYGILDYSNQLIEMISATRSKQKAFTTKKEEDDTDVRQSVIQLQTFVNKSEIMHSSAPTINPILIEELENERNSSYNVENRQATSSSCESNATSDIQQNENHVDTTNLSQSIFNKEAIIVAIVGDFAVLLTFGLTFPPLALMIAISIASTTFYHQWELSRMLIMLQNMMNKPITSVSSVADYNANQRKSIWRLSKATTNQLLTSLEAKSAFKQIIADCGGDLMQLFWPVIPSLAILSAVFIGAFLFDILGDEVGVLQALWILLVMGTMPLWIWCGEYLYLAFINRYIKKLDEEEQQKELDREPQRNSEQEVGRS